MDAGFLLIILIFVIISILEGISKKRRQQTQQRQEEYPEPDAPGESAPDYEPEWQSEADEPREETAQTAEDMIPDDLWEILTGEKRQRTKPPEPEPEPEYRSERHYEQDVAYAPEPEPVEDETEVYIPPDPKAPGAEPIAQPEAARRVPWAGEKKRFREHKKPIQVVELEDEQQQQPMGGLGLRLGERDQLRRAIVLREVLGPPRGLEDDPKYR